MNNNQLFEILKIDPRTVPDEVEFWALHAVSFYERIFSKIDDPERVEDMYIVMSKKLHGRIREAAEFFAAIRIAEIEDPNFWDRVGRKDIGEGIRAKFINESRHFDRGEDPRKTLGLSEPEDTYWYAIIGKAILQNISKKEVTEKELLFTIRDAVMDQYGNPRPFMNDNDFLSDTISYVTERGIKLIPEPPIQRV